MSIIELVRDIWMSNACVKLEEHSLNPSKVITLTKLFGSGGGGGGPRGGCVADENIIFPKTYVSQEYNNDMEVNLGCCLVPPAALILTYTGLSCIIHRVIMHHTQGYHASYTGLSCIIHRVIMHHTQGYHASYTGLSCIIHRVIMHHTQGYHASYTGLSCIIHRVIMHHTQGYHAFGRFALLH